MSRLVFGLLAIATLLVFGFCQECNICNAENGVACVSNTAFKMCNVSNSPIGDSYNCPTDSKCTGSRRICETGATLKGACESCDICSSEAVFKCTSKNQFALCVDPDSTIKYECAGSYVCNIENQKICGDPSELPPTCGEDTTPTVPTNMTADEYCGLTKQPGRFPRGADKDTTCHQYIYCYQRSDIWYGNAYVCPGTLYFNPVLKHCHKDLPSTCTSTIRNLAVKGRILL